MSMPNKQILVVEDEAPIREMLKFALERADFRVSLAGNAAEGRLRIADQQPDLILMDWMMPGVSGVERRSTALMRAINSGNENGLDT